MMNKKGYSIGFTWVFALVTLFGIGILYIAFTQVFDAHLVPTIKDLTDNSTMIGGQLSEETSNEIHGNIDKYMAFWHMFPVIMFFVVIIYILIASFKKEPGSSY